MSQSPNNQVIKLYESFDVQDAKALIYSGVLNELDRSKLQTFLLRGRNTGSICVEYEDVGIGRFKSRVPGKNGAFCPHFMCGITGDIRRCISGRFVHDIDIQCCHPTLLLKITKDHELPCELLESYVKHCKEWRKKVAKDCGVALDVAKSLFNRMVYGGGYREWAKDNNVAIEKIIPEIVAFYEEMNANRDKILVHFPECIEHQKTAKPNHWNPEASAMFFVLAEQEKKCLKVMIEAGFRCKLKPHSLMHDGLTFERITPVEKGEELTNMPQEILDILEKSILRSTGFKVKLAEKSMTSKLLDDVHLFTVENDSEAADQFLEHYKDKIYRDQEDNRIFVLDNGLWSDMKIDDKMLKMCLDMDIVKEKDKEYVCYSKDVPTAKRIIEAVKAKLQPTYGFTKSLFNSNLGKLVFKDGVYDFATATFTKFSDDPELVNKVRSTIRIEREYPQAANLVDTIAKVKKDVLDPILPNENRQKYFLQSCARGLAGHIEDKEWCSCIGARNAGKGVIVGCFEEAFGGYIGAFNADSFLYKTNIGDAAKDKSWMIDHEFKRLIFSNECTIDTSKGLKMNGNMIKNFASGGDPLIARKNHKDEIYFRVQSKLMLMCNDLPPINPPDALETMTQITFESVFAREVPEGAPSHVKLANADIKAWVRDDPLVKDAFLLLVLDHYSRARVTPPTEVVLDTKEWVDTESFSESVMKHYEITCDPNDKELSNNVVKKLSDLSLSSQKITKEFKQLGVVKHKSNGLCYYIGLKPIRSYEIEFIETD